MFVSNDVFFDSTRVVMLFGRHTLVQSPTREAARSGVRVHSSPVFGLSQRKNPANQFGFIAKDHLSQRLHMMWGLVTRERSAPRPGSQNRIMQIHMACIAVLAFSRTVRAKGNKRNPLHGSGRTVYRRRRVALRGPTAERAHDCQAARYASIEPSKLRSKSDYSPLGRSKIRRREGINFARRSHASRRSATCFGLTSRAWAHCSFQRSQGPKGCLLFNLWLIAWTL